MSIYCECYTEHISALREESGGACTVLTVRPQKTN
jgi:hypothetical protein